MEKALCANNREDSLSLENLININYNLCLDEFSIMRYFINSIIIINEWYYYFNNEKILINQNITTEKSNAFYDRLHLIRKINENLIE